MWQITQPVKIAVEKLLLETFLTDTMHETLAGVCDVKIEMASQQRTPRSSSDASDLISMT